MPQGPVLVYECATGQPSYMHSVDAEEAVRLGDYTYAMPKGKEPEGDAKASAMARFKGMNPVAHPEMQSPDERERHRQEANTVLAPVVTVPTDTPVVLHAGAVPTGAPASSEPEGRHRRQAADEGKK